MPRDLVGKLLYLSGALGLYHRLRNRRNLTVVMFHRVIDVTDPRWPTCDPDYTISSLLFERVLAFFGRHYNVVSLAQVLGAQAATGRLPARPLLITFDDGWADNADFALPALQRASMPALMFVVTDAIGRRQPFFQERLMVAWRRGALTVAQLREALHGLAPAGVPPAETLPALRAAIAAIETLDPGRREQVLAPFQAVLDDGLRHMVDRDDLQRVQAGGVDLGLHGKTHQPLTTVDDLDAELDGARGALRDAMGGAARAAEAMSFPHGAHDMDIASRARQAGYRLVFTSVPVLNPVTPQPGWLLGRTGFETADIVDARGWFRPDRLALYLFRRQPRRLA